MRKLVSLCVFLIYAVLLALPVSAATRQPVSREYIDRYFTTVAAASCLGVYLPDNSTEFNYLRSYGWKIFPQQLKSGRVETDFIIAKNYFPEFKKQIYLVTFRGSANKKDWQINLKTGKVNFGGTTPAEMATAAAAPMVKGGPGVHGGFNTYVDEVMRASVVDEQGNLKGVFQKVRDNDDSALVLTGHSLGGAAATLLGERLVAMGLPKEKFTVVTFGAPAVGNQPFAEQYGDAINLLRITNTADPVPGSLQTFFGGYKQFGQHIKYSLSPKISSMQHDMAMYFDYSVSRLYEEFDRQVQLDRLRPLPQSKVTGSTPVVALWINEADRLHNVATITDLKRFITDEYRRMFPSYVVMDTSLGKDAYTRQDIIQQSRYVGADYILVCGIDGTPQREDDYWYLTLEQALFDGEGRLVTMGSSGRKVAPAVGNVQAAGENMVEARKELAKWLPFVITEYKPVLAQE